MNGITGKSADRREFLKKTGTLLAGAVLVSPTIHLAQARDKAKEEQNAEVSPPEDLMREHGVLRRILLIYENIQDRLNTGTEFSAHVLSGAADIIRKFIEEYHEKLEEEHLFPRFEKAGKLTELVKVLREQHRVGRSLTEYIRTSSAGAALKDAGKRRELGEKMQLFIRMYRPHAAREDTILFPVVRSIMSPQEFASMGERFEDKETELFGEGGFEKIVGKVADLEKPLGIYQLAQFTPPA